MGGGCGRSRRGHTLDCVCPARVQSPRFPLCANDAITLTLLALCATVAMEEVAEASEATRKKCCGYSGSPTQMRSAKVSARVDWSLYRLASASNRRLIQVAYTIATACPTPSLSTHCIAAAIGIAPEPKPTAKSMAWVARTDWTRPLMRLMHVQRAYGR